MSTASLSIAAVIAALAFGYVGAPLWLWTAGVAALLYAFQVPTGVWIGFGVVAALLNLPFIRRYVLSLPVMQALKSFGLIPRISETERTALDAGVVWVEKELFSGKLNFKKVLGEPYPKLTSEEQAFLDGPVEDLCSHLDDWQIQADRQMPPELWDRLKKSKVLGMIIPKEYGGLGFSAMAHSEVIHKLASRCQPLAITAMVPNSLGPAELLNHYGTEAQKQHYLPRLATGEEIPCFALTEPGAGSDAGSLTSSGDVFKGKDGKLMMRLNWNKRWITLAAKSTVVGLAFRLRDPENHLGKGEDLGITCALVPAATPGVILGKRHDPMGIPFYNCPTQGENVEVDLDHIIGGPERAGQGWTMLMESLSAGRGISLPASATGGSKLITRYISAHSVVRRQFGLPIGKFEGVEEPLARIFGFTYLLEAVRRYTLGGLDQGIKPPVVTAIVKYNATELGRKIVNDGMDVAGGAGISRGPRNILSSLYWGAPISITVEGANILTRTLIVFGQGALRAHPFAYQEIKAVEDGDLAGFDRAFWGHIGHVIRNSVRSVLLSVTRGYLTFQVGGPLSRYKRQLSWASASFGITADVSMGVLGASLKMKEKITGRFADILSWMYMITAVIRRWEAEGQRKEDLPFVHFVCRYGFHEIQRSFEGIYNNLSFPGMSWAFRLLGSWSRFNAFTGSIPDDLSQDVVKKVLFTPEIRDHLTDGMFIPKDANEQIARLDNAMRLSLLADGAERKIRKAIKKKQLPKKKIPLLVEEAHKQGIITDQEREGLAKAVEARWDAIQVDSFTEEEYLGKSATKPNPKKSGPEARAFA